MTSSEACRTGATRVSSAAVAADGTTHSVARRSAVAVHARKKRAFTDECNTASVKNVASCSVTTDAADVASGIV